VAFTFCRDTSAVDDSPANTQVPPDKTSRALQHLKRIGPLRSGRVRRHVLQTFREEDPLGSMILLALFSIPPISKATTIRGSVMEIHYGAGRAAGAEHVTVTLYRRVLGSSDLQK
jgi:hypothetical protein